jgi:hypothetical protein
VTGLRTLPTLDELAAEPGKVDALPVEAVKRLLVRNRAVGEALLARLISEPAGEPKSNGMEGDDRLIGAAAVGEMIGRSRSWVEHHLDKLPPRLSLIGEPVWLKRDVERWIKGLPKYGEKKTEGENA